MNIFAKFIYCWLLFQQWHHVLIPSSWLHRWMNIIGYFQDTTSFANYQMVIIIVVSQLDQEKQDWVRNWKKNEKERKISVNFTDNDHQNYRHLTHILVGSYFLSVSFFLFNFAFVITLIRIVPSSLSLSLSLSPFVTIKNVHLYSSSTLKSYTVLLVRHWKDYLWFKSYFF